MKRSGASTSVVAGLFIVGLLIGAGVTYIAVPSLVSPSTTTSTTTVMTTITATGGVAAPASCGPTPTGGKAVPWSPTPETPPTTPLTGTVTIGVLSDLSDGLSSEGLRVQAYAQQAATDINAWLATTAYSGVNFKVNVVDYKGDPTQADNALKAMAAEGISVVVGPLSSGILGAIYKDAASSHVVLISPSSTSPAYYGVSPYVYRTAPNDVFQGAADSCMMLSQGVKAVVIVYRDDTYGYGLYNYTSADFAAAGGKVDAVPYSTTLEGQQAFNSIASTVNSDYNNLVSTYGASHVAIDAISFEEIGYLLKAVQASYPSLLTTIQPWYGTDGENGDTALTNSTYGSLMQQIRMPATVFGYTNSSKTLALCAKFTQPSLSCDSYALGAYDDVWLGALSILQCGENNGACVSNVLPSVANSYYGVTGWTQLQTPTGVGGDRKGGDFQIWCVENPPAGINWYLCGDWSSATNSVTWLPSATVPNP